MTTNIDQANAVICDDHAMFADSFSFFLESLKIFRSVYSFTQETELIKFLLRQPVPEKNYLFIDYYLTEKNGLSVVNDARRISKSLKIVMLSSITNPILINDIIQHKPDAFLSKSAGLSEVLEAIRTIDNGYTYQSPYFEKILSSGQLINSGYTDRELELLQYFAKGYSIESTAKALFLSTHTIVAHRKKMMKKANCKSIIELLSHARTSGLI